MPNSRYENAERSKMAPFWVSSPHLSRHDAPAGEHTIGDVIREPGPVHAGYHKMNVNVNMWGNDD